ncbi:MAG: HD domain-containing protein [Thermotogae bacterium]|uniref:PAS domain S-box n=4 Tax=Mesotoga TaxID=1184396 RepID=I2F7S5_9BACT|nr:MULTISPECIES: HD domain-containing phosphohydrolase [Mesotoga]AFK07978.1 PAS domain S-box [Mesotoga prima MesG1.Ag.4.2]MCP5461491.1 HD domain-containing protein [Thermotogota bacterium]RLL89124.1 diguanylate cyclase [Mesotoga sp. H07pep.5.4]
MKNPALKVALLYVVFGVIWILFSDMIVDLMFVEKDLVAHAQTYKGWAFVIFSGILFYFLIYREFSEKNKTQLELVKQKDLSDAVLDTVGVFVAVLDSEGVIVFTNETFEEILSLKSEDIIGKNCSEVFASPDLANWIENTASKTLDREIENFYEADLETSSTTLHIRWALSNLTSWRGEHDYFVLTGVDITQLVESERSATHRLANIRALHEIDMAVSYHLELEKMLDVFLERLISRLGVDGADVFLIDEERSVLRFAHGKGIVTGEMDFRELPMEGTIPSSVASSGKPYSGPLDTSSNPECPRLKNLIDMKVKDYHAVPLETRGKILGVLETFDMMQIHRDSEWNDFLQMLAAQASLAIDVALMIDNLKDSNRKIAEAYDQTLEVLVGTLEMRDMNTKKHSRRVADLTVWLAEKMGASEEEIENMYRGALLHDIGKISIPDSVLLKEGPLSEDEWKVMKTHPTTAYEVLSQVEYLRPSLDIPYCHHERWDGSGYPRGLKGEEIPLAARIFAVVDVYDALTSDRPYRKAWSKEKTVEYLLENSGKLFDPAVIEKFLEILRVSSPS